MNKIILLHSEICDIAEHYCPVHKIRIFDNIDSTADYIIKNANEYVDKMFYNYHDIKLDKMLVTTHLEKTYNKDHNQQISLINDYDDKYQSGICFTLVNDYIDLESIDLCDGDDLLNFATNYKYKIDENAQSDNLKLVSIFKSNW